MSETLVRMRVEYRAWARDWFATVDYLRFGKFYRGVISGGHSREQSIRNVVRYARECGRRLR